MNTETVVMPANTKKPSRINGILIPAMIIVPMVLAYIMFYTGWGVPLSTTNKGEFLSPPQPVQELNLLGSSNILQSTFADDAQKRWRILVPVTAHCNDACADNLYLTRQVHIRLAQKAYRVERILVLVDQLSATQREALEKEHRTTMIVQSTKENFAQWLAPTGLAIEQALGQYYLLDQEGFAMMQYNNTHTGQDLLDDLKKLLKFTYDN